MRWLISSGVARAAAVLLAATACHTIVEELPEKPSPIGLSPGPAPVIVVTPITLPTPTAPAPQPSTPAPTPTPTPQAAPTPTPATPPPTSSGSCNLPKGTGSGENCPYESASFQSAVDAAIDYVIQTDPSNFSNSGTCSGCVAVKDGRRYINAVVARLEQRSYCAFYDGEEVAVKNTNAFNDQYNIYTSSGLVRRGSGSYRSTCYPAWF